MKLSLLILGLSLNLSFCFAQKNHDEILRDILKQRQQMIEEMMKAFDDDFFKADDSFFDQNMFGQIFEFQSGNEGVKVERLVLEDGSIELHITPKNKNVSFEIETKDKQVIIKGKTIVKEENKDNKGRSTSTFSSTFQKSYSIPYGYKAQNPVKRGDTIVLKMIPINPNFRKKMYTPKRRGIKPQRPKRDPRYRPLKPAPGDITI